MRKVLFVCEGSTEIFLLYKILEKKLNIIIDSNLKENGNLNLKKIKEVLNRVAQKGNIEIYIANLDGETKLNFYIEELVNHREFEDLDKVLFIMDADHKQGTETGFERTKKAIEEATKKLKENNDSLEINCFITPDNENDGMTENILVEAMRCKKITYYIKNDVIPTLCSMEGNEIKNKDKSTFMIVAATQNPLRVSAPSFISTCFDKLDMENIYLKSLVLFIEKSLI